MPRLPSPASRQVQDALAGGQASDKLMGLTDQEPSRPQPLPLSDSCGPGADGPLEAGPERGRAPGVGRKVAFKKVASMEDTMCHSQFRVYCPKGGSSTHPQTALPWGGSPTLPRKVPDGPP